MKVAQILKQAAVSTFVEYDTPKVVHIRSKFVGICNRLVQLAVITYVIVYVFIINRGYQYLDAGGVSATTTKLKGVAYTNTTDIRVGQRVWDSSDLNVPPEENGAFFLTTNVLTTQNQTQGECTEVEWVKAECLSDAECLPVGKPFHLGHGVSAGRCDNVTGRCIVKAWCPIENDDLPEGGQYAMLNQTKDFTVLVKNHVYFPHYNKQRSNLLDFIDKPYLRKCQYHHIEDPFCPIFRLQDIVSIAETKESGNIEYSDSYYQSLAIKGGVVSIRVKWVCDFDYDENECTPTYDFTRLDNYKGNKVASGYNFRYPVYYYEEGAQKRHLVKAYGILFIIITEAEARKFDPVTFFLNLGSGMALLGIAAICSDIVLMNLHRQKDYFKDNIIENISMEPTKSSRGKHSGSSSHTSLPKSGTNFTEIGEDSATTLLNNGCNDRDPMFDNGKAPIAIIE